LNGRPSSHCNPHTEEPHEDVSTLGRGTASGPRQRTGCQGPQAHAASGGHAAQQRVAAYHDAQVGGQQRREVGGRVANVHGQAGGARAMLAPPGRGRHQPVQHRRLVRAVLDAPARAGRASACVKACCPLRAQARRYRW